MKSAQKLGDRIYALKYLILFFSLFQFLVQNQSAFSQSTELLRFLAIAGDEQAEIIWETKHETNLAGFILFRCDRDSAVNFFDIATYLIDSTLVAKNEKGQYNSRYSWMDVGIINGKQYWYKLRIVAQNDAQWEHGPIAVIPADGVVIYQAAETLGWEWQNPLPSGNILKDVDFVDDDHGWIAGERNTILRTTNGGKSWKFLNSGVELPKTAGSFGHINFENVKFFDRNNGLVSGCIYSAVGDSAGCSIILKTSNSGETWQQSFAYTYPWLGQNSPSLFFLNSSDGWAGVVPEGFFRTYDGGDHWASLPIDFHCYPLELEFAGEQGIWIVNLNEATSNLYDRVRYTSDDGVSWQSLHQGINGDFLDIEFLNLEKGWVLGNDWDPQLSENKGLILTTTNGGRNWHIQATIPDYLIALDMANDHQGWCAAGRYNGDLNRYEGAIYRTEDDWQSWSKIDLGNYQPFDLFALDAQHAWVVGCEGLILATSDSGNTWQRGAILSADSNWIYLNNLFFVNENYGWATGTLGAFCPSPWYNPLLHTKDGGKTWNIIWKSDSTGFENIVFIDSLQGWALGDGIFHTTDGSYQWSLQYQTLDRGPWANICFIDSLYGWVLEEYGKIIYTQNGGQTWLEQPRFSHGLTALTFVDPGHGWVVGGYGKILHTAQGGLAKTTALPISSNIKPEVVMNFQLHQNYPNPFNPITTIPYTLPSNTKVTLKIYNLLGQEVKVFFENENLAAGQHQVIWDSCDDNGQPLASGIYFCCMKTKHFMETKKIFLIR